MEHYLDCTQLSHSILFLQESGHCDTLESTFLFCKLGRLLGNQTFRPLYGEFVVQNVYRDLFTFYGPIEIHPDPQVVKKQRLSLNGGELTLQVCIFFVFKLVIYSCMVCHWLETVNAERMKSASLQSTTNHVMILSFNNAFDNVSQA